MRTGMVGIFCLLLAMAGVAADQAVRPATSSSRIAFIRGGNLWLMNADGSNQRQLSQSGKCAHPGWSPDGEYIVFENAKNIWAMKAADGTVRRLTTTGDCRTPAWRPGSQQIWFVREIFPDPKIPFGMTLWRVDPSGGSAQRCFPLTNITGPRRLAWNANGQLLLAGVYYVANAGSVLCRPDGTIVETSYDGKRGETPEWSPVELDVLAIDSNGYSSPNRLLCGRLLRGSISSQQEVTLYSCFNDSGVRWPTWSPDGRKLAFCQATDSTSGIVLVGADGSGATAICSNGMSPSWSPGSGSSTPVFPPASKLPTKPTTAAPPRSTPSYQPDIRWGNRGTGAGQLAVPFGIAVAQDGSVYVTECENHRVQKFASDGRFLCTWGSGGSGPGQFSTPTGVAVDAGGNVFVADSANQRIQKFSSQGRLLTKWTAPQTSRAGFFPSGIAVDAAGCVYVTSEDCFRVWKFNSSGQFLKCWGRSPRSGEWNDVGNSGCGGLAVDARGVLYVVNVVTNAVERYNSNGDKLPELVRMPAGYVLPAIGPDGNIYVPNRQDETLVVFSPNGNKLAQWGSEGDGPGQFRAISGVAFDPAGNLYVTDAQGCRVQKFRPAHSEAPVQATPGRAAGSAEGTAEDSGTAGPAGNIQRVYVEMARTPQPDQVPVGDVHAVYRDGKDSALTSSGNCGDVLLAPDGRTVGWTVYEPFYANTTYHDPAPYPTKLRIFRDGAIIRSIDDYGLVLKWYFCSKEAKSPSATEGEPSPSSSVTCWISTRGPRWKAVRDPEPLEHSRRRQPGPSGCTNND